MNRPLGRGPVAPVIAPADPRSAPALRGPTATTRPRRRPRGRPSRDSRPRSPVRSSPPCRRPNMTMPPGPWRRSRRTPRTTTPAPSIAVLRGTALRLAGKLDAAREALSGALKDCPEGGRGRPSSARSWRPSRSPPASSRAAEALARAEAEALLAGDRKDRLAEVYRGFADRLLKPDLPTVAGRPRGGLRPAGPGPRPGQGGGAPGLAPATRWPVPARRPATTAARSTTSRPT